MNLKALTTSYGPLADPGVLGPMERPTLRELYVYEAFPEYMYICTYTANLQLRQVPSTFEFLEGDVVGILFPPITHLHMPSTLHGKGLQSSYTYKYMALFNLRQVAKRTLYVLRIR